MRLELSNNAELVIQANNQPGDYELVNRVAEEMAKDSSIDIASADDQEQWVHLCARWDYFQREELRDAYYAAKKTLSIN